MKQKIMYQPEFSYIKWNIVHVSMCVFEWMKSPSQSFWSSEITTCIPIPPSQQSGDHLTSESVISHHVCHIKISHGETSRESKKYETQKTLPFLTVMYFFGELYRKSLPFIFACLFFSFLVRWCTLAPDHLGASTGSLITYKCLHITEY